MAYVATSNGMIYAMPTNGSSTSTPSAYVSPGGSLAGLAWLDNRLYVAMLALAGSSGGYVAVYPDHVQHNSSSTVPTMELALTDEPLVSVGYNPYGVRALGGRVYITYTNSSSKPGSGYVDVYDPCGCKSLRRIINRDNLSIPFGMYQNIDGIPTRNDSRSDESCGDQRDKDDDSDDNVGELFVGNAGTGYISKFTKSEDSKCFEYIDTVKNRHNATLITDGIMGIVRHDNKLYYVCSSDGGNIGSLGVMYRD